jgi:hypothetical protein
MDATTEQLIQRNFAIMAERLAKAERRIRMLETQDGGFLSGSFVPTLVGSGVAGTFTYVATLIEWAVIGNRLFFNGRIGTTAITVAPTLNMSINGWPFPAVSDATMVIAGVGVLMWRGINLPANFWSVSLQFANGQSVATLIRSGTNNNFTQVQGAEMLGSPAGTLDLRFGGSYRVA